MREVAHELRGPGSTLGGARPKSDFEDADGTLHVAKYTTELDRLPVERMEVATLRLAAEVGLRVAKGRLALGRTEYPVALIERFDRDGEQRLHYVSAKTFLGFTSNETGCYADLADAMRSACGDGLRGELRELHRRLVFNILVSNDDDHLKNPRLPPRGRKLAVVARVRHESQPGWQFSASNRDRRAIRQRTVPRSGR